MRTQALHFFLLLLPFSLISQTNVRGWYADGQVWIVWEETAPQPETYAIYGKGTAFSNTDDALLLGRLFVEEWKPGALRAQIDPTATYRIPNGNGGIYQLAPNEGLFVATPHQAGALWVAVVKWGETVVTPGINLSVGPVSFDYDPVNDPVECHLQKVFSPTPGYGTLAYYMWSDGRQNQWENRPDVPVTANQAKNGMPYYFVVSGPVDIDTTQAVPATIWLHGGGGTAIQSLPDGRPIVNLFPEEGLLVSHNDDLFGYILSGYIGFETVTWHFGWRKNYDPFSMNNAPTEVDTVVNYTQRRYIWIDEWLQRRFNVDPDRININGHSMGSAGATALAKAYPDHYASATIFNNGFGGPDSLGPLNAVLFGPANLDFPTNLVDYEGNTVHMNSVFNLTHRIAPARDLPLMRSYHGKNDDNGIMEWDAYVVEQYREADSLGFGMQLFWSERAHGIDTGPALGDHWAYGNGPTEQTVIENVAWEEAHLLGNRSFPAFFNHRLDPNARDPGDGTIGTGAAGVGDDWGTWGGYHRWDWENGIDEPDWWRTIAWLESEAIFDNDNCPVDFLVADMAIRKPQQFDPQNLVLLWIVSDANTGTILQEGFLVDYPDNLVVLPQVKVYREDIRRVHIDVFATTATKEALKPAMDISIFPNPSSGEAFLKISSKQELNAQIIIRSTDGRIISKTETKLLKNKNEIPLQNNQQLKPGIYMVEIITPEGKASAKWVVF